MDALEIQRLAEQMLAEVDGDRWEAATALQRLVWFNRARAALEATGKGQ